MRLWAKYADLTGFLRAYFGEASPKPASDEGAVREFVQETHDAWRKRVLDEGKRAVEEPKFPLADIAESTGRSFASAEAAREWLAGLLRIMEDAGKGG